ncbi:MAG: A/G-specific adenine glycosylase [Clostridia bacterium]|nr:A/G-specific adenine glycosylase [Clostridia bacterium]
MKMDNKLNEIVIPLLTWYRIYRRDLPWRHDPTPYRVWVSEIMLQQTRVDPVIPYYLRFMEILPDVEALAAISEDALMKLWEGLGYYSRARNLQKAAKQIVENGAFPADFNGWRSLPGIGDYTAGAICSIAMGLPTPAVDGNVLRVLSRILGSYEDIAAPATKKAFTEALREVYPLGATSEFTQSLMELGAIICLPNGAPLCEKCPLKELCTAKKEDLIDQIPVKSEKKKRKKEEKTVFILRFGSKIALNRRPEKGLLANLWEFPNINGHLSQKDALDHFAAADPLSITRLSESFHIFTHIEWHMQAYEIVARYPSEEYIWMELDDVLLQKAIPSAFRCYTNYLKESRYKEIQE